jgi:hypothetical protein
LFDQVFENLSSGTETRINLSERMPTIGGSNHKVGRALEER